MPDTRYSDMTLEERRAYLRDRKRASRARAASGAAPALSHDTIARVLVEAVAVLLDREPAVAERVMDMAALAYAFPPGARLRISRHLRRLRRTLLTEDALVQRLSEDAPRDGAADPFLTAVLDRMGR